MSFYLSDLINKFNTFLTVERNLSPVTREDYNYYLKKFMEYLIHTHGREPSLESINADMIRKFMEHFQVEHDYKSASIARVISTLRAFFRFCVEHEYLKVSPAAIIRNPKLPKKLPIYLIDSEVKLLLQAPDRSTDMGCRDYAIIVTLGFTGIRLQELVHADLSSVDFERETIKVFGKGAKERLIPLNNLVINALRDYIDKRPVSDSQAIFLNKFGKRLSGRSIENIVKRYVRQAGISKIKISPHKLRHTFATLLHLNDVDILEIQKLLGHSAITSTQIYTHTNPDKLKKAVDKLEDFS
ncbi:tyrosine-type recombinase/integrase [Candidatus Sumerlaeota bacterium]|nr:tyrosine-type recombinase/integrase [Candidatus Sumerlaeota bacterium]